MQSKHIIIYGITGGILTSGVIYILLFLFILSPTRIDTWTKRLSDHPAALRFLLAYFIFTILLIIITIAICCFSKIKNKDN